MGTLREMGPKYHGFYIRHLSPKVATLQRIDNSCTL